MKTMANRFDLITECPVAGNLQDRALYEGNGVPTGFRTKLQFLYISSCEIEYLRLLCPQYSKRVQLEYKTLLDTNIQRHLQYSCRIYSSVPIGLNGIVFLNGSVEPAKILNESQDNSKTSLCGGRERLGPARRVIVDTYLAMLRLIADSDKRCRFDSGPHNLFASLWRGDIGRKALPSGQPEQLTRHNFAIYQIDISHIVPIFDICGGVDGHAVTPIHLGGSPQHSRQKSSDVLREPERNQEGLGASESYDRFEIPRIAGIKPGPHFNFSGPRQLGAPHANQQNFTDNPRVPFQAAIGFPHVKSISRSLVQGPHFRHWSYGMDIVNLKISNWAKFNTKETQKTPHWFKVHVNIGSSESLFGLTPATKWIWVCLLSEAMRKKSGEFSLNLNWASHQWNIRKQEISDAIELLEKNGLLEADSEETRSPLGVDSEPTRSELGADSEETPSRKRIERDKKEKEKESAATATFIPKELKDSWVKTYEDEKWIEFEIKKAQSWIVANPTEAPKTLFSRFYNSWLSRGWESYRKTISIKKHITTIQPPMGVPPELNVPFPESDLSASNKELLGKFRNKLAGESL